MKEAEVLIQLPFATQEQREKIFQIEKLLLEAGVSFDTGSDGITRDWEFDWSLEGAKVFFKKFKDEKDDN